LSRIIPWISTPALYALRPLAAGPLVVIVHAGSSSRGTASHMDPPDVVEH